MRHWHNLKGTKICDIDTIQKVKKYATLAQFKRFTNMQHWHNLKGTEICDIDTI